MHIISVRRQPELIPAAIKYIHEKWGNEKNFKMYENCIRHCSGTSSALPQWYLLFDYDKIIGCAGLVTNDFISRMDLYPWICCLFVERDYRGNRYSAELIKQAKQDAGSAGYKNIYLCTNMTGFFEKFRFEYIGIGYHPWGGSSRIYSSKI